MSQEEAKKLIKRDEAESLDFGQKTRDVFQLSDAFINLDDSDYQNQIGRVLDLIFGDPFKFPTKDEFAMYLTYASSWRSADLSRQVGAVITTSSGEVIATGTNDVPRAGGGLYWTGDKEDHRDYTIGYDPNEIRRKEIAREVIEALQFDSTEESLTQATEQLKNTGLFDITEYGRIVHAEMEAILSCARVGISTRNCTLYSTTLPCHNCAKHIIASGIKRVVYIEPYPKSRAEHLHSDAIVVDSPEEAENSKKVSFVPFVGVGPRRFMDFFSMRISSGYKKRRKEDGYKVNWLRKNAQIRVPLPAISYIEAEKLLTIEFSKLEEAQNATKDKG
jgi:deoxycytidylate deaminase